MTRPRAERPWDIALASITANAVRLRRKNPDGEERKVRYQKTDTGVIRRYPWDEMIDGDYFIVPIEGSKNAMVTTFRQAAARKDIEVSIHDWAIEKGSDVTPAFRVTRIMGNIRKVKALARERGAKAPHQKKEDIYKRQREARRRRRDGEDTPSIGIVTVLPSTPTEAPGAVGSAPVAPLQYDRRERLAEARRKAAMELTGLDPDEDEDYMGVSGG